MGQTKPVTVYRLITRNTVEEKILHRAKQKDKIQSLVIGAGEKISTTAVPGDDSDVFQASEVMDLLMDDEQQETMGLSSFLVVLNYCIF